MGQKLSTSTLTSTPLVMVKNKVGETFTGVFISVRSVEFDYGVKNVYDFSAIDGDMPIQVKKNDKYVDVDISEGAQVSIFAPTRLDTALKQAKNGMKLKITYLGLGKKPKKGGNKPHEYDVEVVE